MTKLCFDVQKQLVVKCVEVAVSDCMDHQDNHRNNTTDFTAENMPTVGSLLGQYKMLVKLFRSGFQYRFKHCNVVNGLEHSPSINICMFKRAHQLF